MQCSADSDSHGYNSIAIRSSAIHLNNKISGAPSQTHRHSFSFLIGENVIRLIYGNIKDRNIIDSYVKPFTDSHLGQEASIQPRPRNLRVIGFRWFVWYQGRWDQCYRGWCPEYSYCCNLIGALSNMCVWCCRAIAQWQTTNGKCYSLCNGVDRSDPES